jgi:hypothetical protein
LQVVSILIRWAASTKPVEPDKLWREGHGSIAGRTKNTIPHGVTWTAIDLHAANHAVFHDLSDFRIRNLPMAKNCFRVLEELEAVTEAFFLVDIDLNHQLWSVLLDELDRAERFIARSKMPQISVGHTVRRSKLGREGAWIVNG